VLSYRGVTWSLRGALDANYSGSAFHSRVPLHHLNRSSNIRLTSVIPSRRWETSPMLDSLGHRHGFTLLEYRSPRLTLRHHLVPIATFVGQSVKDKVSPYPLR
jgi:hypothetical protein